MASSSITLFLVLFFFFTSIQARGIPEEQTKLFDPCIDLIYKPWYCYYPPPPPPPHHHHHHHNHKRMCKSVTTLLENCGGAFDLDEDVSDECCRLSHKISAQCTSGLDHEEQELVQAIKKTCHQPHKFPPSEPDQPPPAPPTPSLPPPPPSPFPSQPPPTPSPPPPPPSPSPSQPPPPPKQPPSLPTPAPKQPPVPAPTTKPTEPTPSPPPSTPPPAPKQPPHPQRPETCKVESVLYDSCDPKYPVANDKNSSQEDQLFIPSSLSTGFMTDGAGCCLGFAVFTNNCRPDVKDLSFAKQKVFVNLQRPCARPY